MGFIFWAGDGFLGFTGKFAKCELGIPREGWNERSQIFVIDWGQGLFLEMLQGMKPQSSHWARMEFSAW